MLTKIRNWKYSYILRGSVFFAMAILSLFLWGIVRFLLFGAYMVISVICFCDKQLGGGRPVK